jgi:hypothetical protein
MTHPDMREAFEAWARADGSYGLGRSEMRKDWYIDGYTQAAWLAYQAASAAETARAVGVVKAAEQKGRSEAAETETLLALRYVREQLERIDIPATKPRFPQQASHVRDGQED